MKVLLKTDLYILLLFFVLKQSSIIEALCRQHISLRLALHSMKPPSKVLHLYLIYDAVVFKIGFTIRLI